jgi:hypothetical protein
MHLQMGASFNRINLGKRQLSPLDISRLENFSISDNPEARVLQISNKWIITIDRPNLLNLLLNIPPTQQEEVYIYSSKGRLLKKSWSTNYQTHVITYSPRNLFGKRVC